MPMPQSPQDRASALANKPPTGVPIVILDTNVVLDLLLFRNPECAGLQAALDAEGVRWLATPAMREELAQVLARGGPKGWAPDLARIWSQWDRHCTPWPQPSLVAAEPRLRCTDPDDQKFIDLALASAAHWLLTRDRAVLALAQRMSERGIEVVTPNEWAPLSPEAS
jgi:predicted nucleic acid-binding protein